MMVANNSESFCKYTNNTGIKNLSFTDFIYLSAIIQISKNGKDHNI